MDTISKDSSHDEVIAQVLKIIEKQADSGLLPSFQDMVGARIKDYAAFTNKLIQANNADQFDAIVEEHSDAKAVNDEVQRYIRLHQRCIVVIDPSEVIQQHIYHPAVQFVSKDAFGCEESEDDFADFYDILNSVVLSATVGQILGGIKYWVTADILNPEEYALVHNLSSTVH